MVGLGIVLEEGESKKNISINNNNNNTHQVINKTTITMNMVTTINNKKISPLSYSSSHHFPFQKSTFLDQCFLCNKKLLPEKDIYMYK
jgi:hypothetical protein